MSRMIRSPRNSVKDRPGRWVMVRRRLRRMLRPIAWAATASLVGLLGFGLLHAAAPGGTLAGLRERIGGATAFAGLRVRDIVIEGRANTPEPMLRAAIGVAKGDAILGFSVEQARARIETLPWVEHATVERRLPDTLVVQLAERRPFAIWQNQGKFVLIDRAGQVVANQGVDLFRQLPLVVGPGAPAAAALLLDALTARQSLATRIVAAVRVGERRWNLRLSNGIDVLLPEGAEVAALDRLMQLQQNQAVLDRPLPAVDMRLPDKLVLRPIPAEAHPDPTRAAGPKRPT
jgi:cell division protein FtsQ